MSRNQLSPVQYDIPGSSVVAEFQSPVVSIQVPGSQLESEQLAELSTRLKEIGNLADNWDGYSGASISVSAVDGALTVASGHAQLLGTLSIPDAFPTSNGTISMEWQQGNAEAVIEVGDARLTGFVKAGPSAPTYYINAPAGVFYSTLPRVLMSLMSPQNPQAGSFMELRYSPDDKHSE